MFLLVSVLVGLAVGMLAGGRPHGLRSVRLRWTGLALVGLGIELALYPGPLPRVLPEPALRALYVLALLLVLGFTVANRRRPGFAIVALGVASNTLVIAANGGGMPNPGPIPAGYANVVPLTAGSHLVWLADVIDPPWPKGRWLSIGDLLIGVGAAYVVAAALRARDQ